MSDAVDKFVLVEATKTHQGKDKPLHFQENKSRYGKFLDRIIHVVVDEYPEYVGHSAWLLEHHQRNMIMRGLEGCIPEDVILISDIDEIPNRDKIKKFKDEKGIKIFKQRMFYYYLNCINAEIRGSDYSWLGTVMVPYSPTLVPQNLRTLSMNLIARYPKNLWQQPNWWLWIFRNIYWKGETLRFVDSGGWHFSYLGGVERIINKLEAFAHTEYNKEEYKDAQKIKEAINSGKDIFGRSFIYKYIPLDSTYPEYIFKNRDKFQHLLKT